MKFIEKVKAGKATMDDFHDAIDAWHKSTSSEPVEDFLGITKEDYFALLKHPEYLEKLASNYQVASSYVARVMDKYVVVSAKGSKRS
jgi:hypothetical protein